MPPTPPWPTPLPKWVTWLGRLAEPVLWGLITALVTEDHEHDAIEELEWRYVVLRWTKPAITGALEDEAQIGFHLVNITAGDIDTSWTTGDYTACEGHLAEWWNSVKPLVASGYTLKEYRWYKRRFNAAAPWGDLALPEHKRFADSGPPQRITPVGSAGTSATVQQAHQVALSVTLKTPAPGHWGRVYLPGIDAGRIDTNGRWTSGTRTTVANATAELFDDLSGSEFFPLVPITQVDRILTPGIIGVSSIQVDDVPDVIRRRRPKTTLQRTVGVPTA